VPLDTNVLNWQAALSPQEKSPAYSNLICNRELALAIPYGSIFILSFTAGHSQLLLHLANMRRWAFHRTQRYLKTASSGKFAQS
jgi:hypothetical protein